MGSHNVGSTVGSSIGSAATWLWNNKAQIGFYAGAAALLAALPLHDAGAVRDAAEGGFMARTSGKALDRLAQTGTLGTSAANAARRGVGLVHAATSAARDTRVGQSLASVNRSVRDARLALGSSTIGKAMNKASVPLMVVGTVAAGANLADETTQLAQGKGSVQQEVLDALGVIPAGGLAASTLARAGQVRTDAKAASIVADALPKVADHVASVADDASTIAAAAPDELTAPVAKVAELAEKTRVGARATVENAEATTQLAGNVEADDVHALHDQLTQLEDRTRAAKEQLPQVAAAAAEAGETDLADNVADRLQAALKTTTQVRQRVAQEARTSQKLGVAADTASSVSKTTSLTARNAGIVSNSRDLQDRRGTHPKDVINIAKSFAWSLLGRNANAASSAAAVDDSTVDEGELSSAVSG